MNIYETEVTFRHRDHLPVKGTRKVTRSFSAADARTAAGLAAMLILETEKDVTFGFIQSWATDGSDLFQLNPK